jgi:hypothetical protein
MMSWLKGIGRAAIARWNWFWFDSRSEDQLTTLAAFRIAFCLVMFVCYFTRAFDLEFFYGFKGIMPYWHAQSVDYFRFHPSLIRDSWSLLSITALHTAFLILLLCQAAGLFTRASAIGTYFLHMVFLNRNMSVMFGVDMIATFFFLYLCFADSGARFSLDAWRGRAPSHQSARSHIAWRLMQVQVCIIYGFSGMEKLKGTRWWDGSALWDVLSSGSMQRWDLSFVSHFPLLLAAAVYIVLAWEIYFPVLVWVRPMRLPVLFFGVLMHIGIYVFMNLPSFGFMMITLYLLFLRKEEVLLGSRALFRFLRINRPIRS